VLPSGTAPAVQKTKEGGDESGRPSFKSSQGDETRMNTCKWDRSGTKVMAREPSMRCAGSFASGRVLLITLVLAGCANTSDPRAVANATRINFDPYSQLTSVWAATVIGSDFPNSISYDLRAGIPTRGQSFLQLYVRYWSQLGWYFLSSASDVEGTVLPLVQIDRNVDQSANVEEIVGVTLSRDYLENHKSSGLNIRIAGQRGSVVVKVPGAYVAGFLARFDDALAQSGAPKKADVGDRQAERKGLGPPTPTPPHIKYETLPPEMLRK